MAQKKKKQPQKLTKKDFMIFIGDVTYWHKIFGQDKQYEIALEPCKDGFHVALYYLDYSNHIAKKSVIGQKLCTEDGGYGNDPFGELPRSEETWNHALDIANALIETSLKEGQK